jgi:hypothetical protein
LFFEDNLKYLLIIDLKYLKHINIPTNLFTTIIDYMIRNIQNSIATSAENKYNFQNFQFVKNGYNVTITLFNVFFTTDENLYNIKLPETLLNKKGGHERKKYKLDFNKYVYDLNMNEYYEFNVDIKYFYNEELKNKVFQFYKNDFIFFNELCIDYINSDFLHC